MGEQKGTMAPTRKHLSRHEWVALHMGLLEEERKAEVQAAQTQVRKQTQLYLCFVYRLLTVYAIYRDLRPSHKEKSCKENLKWSHSKQVGYTVNLNVPSRVKVN